LVKFKDDVSRNLPPHIKTPLVPQLKSVNILNQRYGVSAMDQVFEKAKNKEATDKGRLKNIYRLSLSKKTDIMEAVQKYQEDSNVIWAEPNYLNFIQATPNDTNFASQWGLNQALDHDIDAPEAWDIQKAEAGSPVPSIAVVDTGVDWDHEDLASNIFINSADPINGSDDDANTFVDDYRGWDFVNTTCLAPGDCSTLYGDLICTDADCSTRDNDPNDDEGHGTLVLAWHQL